MSERRRLRAALAGTAPAADAVTIPRWFLRYHPRLWSELVGEPDADAVRRWEDGTDSNSRSHGMTWQAYRSLWRGVRGWDLYYEARTQWAEQHGFDPGVPWSRWPARPDTSTGDLVQDFASAFGEDRALWTARRPELSEPTGTVRRHTGEAGPS